MRALVLAAGEGQRLRPLTYDRPKPMLPVGDRPLLEQIVCLLRLHGITEIAINLHHKPQSIRDYFGDGAQFGVQIEYSYEEQLLGSAGAVKRLEHYFCDDPFIVFYGDLYTEFELGQLVAVHRSSDALVTMALYEVENPTACGIVELDERGLVTRFIEKPAPGQVFSRLANAGVFVVDPQVIDLIPPDTPFDFGRHVFPRMLTLGMSIQGYVIQELLIDIGTPSNYERAQCVARVRG